uniref:J domain-containing protein n=1 Tax=Meloidogyne enterolobii TaxID=390850 RepID=A0A6V7W3B6_MELEN|nr:unnamed protein product [Meloidogyne enterolobii]CAD2181676.1 unnamed protein product [Meloidogyne enterolobii]
MLLLCKQFAIIFLIILPSCYALNKFDPYETLEIQRMSTQDEIRQAYRRLVKIWHPDKNKELNAEKRFLDINKAYKLLSNIEKRQIYDKTGLTEDQFGDAQGYEQFFRDQQHFQFQYVRWTPPRRQQNDLINFIFPFVSVFGTLLFIFLIGFLLNKFKIDSTHEQHNRRRQNNVNEDFHTKSSQKESNEWHPEDPKTPLTEEEKLQRTQARIWRTMNPLLHELRAETQFGLIRLLKPGCRSIIILVDAESKETLLQQFARHVYCLRNNKTFSFGFLLIPKNLNWFRSLLELTLPEDDKEQQKGDSESVATITTDTNSNENCLENNLNEKIKFEKNGKESKELTIKNRLKNINTKHTIGTVLVICGWRLYFSIYHPMHKIPNRKQTNNIHLEALGDEDLLDDNDEKGINKRNSLRIKNKIIASFEENKQSSTNVENVLNGFPMFLERLLEGTARRYYIPEWPENLT